MTTTAKATKSTKASNKKVTKTPVKAASKKSLKGEATKKTVPKANAKKAPGAKKTVAKKSAAKKTVAKQTPVKVQTGGSNRFFKLLCADGSFKGRFSGKKPKQAANKALTSILNDQGVDKNSVKKAFDFSIVECTRGSKHKTYNYTGKREKLTNPIKVTIKDKQKNTTKTITYKYQNVVSKAKQA